MPNDESDLSIIRAHQKYAPVDVDSLANALGLQVRRVALETGIGGAIRRGPHGYEIYVNVTDHPRRQRFTIAHEIAHFILHRDMIGDGFNEDVMFRGPFGSAAETQANRLAADILMPHSLIRPLWVAGARDVREFARAFEVSPAAMEIRLESFKRAD
jgi:predicted transcriptional regulator